ncbi:hypothetical protein DYBT9275_05568 [Dyadobacter sp. CECT 9275]|uniref:TIGR02453 family protein n=1 Tax=Dyadobacter helix TaxID=2822344 RepID=A0A916N8I0_9BACT|nr:DUF2461 domain-containing protein [Dyadobacter sp. CECT 9275]CAG5016500.1 hypothetical protein DYBT9275_05568 [Dyadobacter sp. CECT 9275]
MLQHATLEFLRSLALNNNREWFQENRSRYDTAKADFEGLVGTLISEVGKFQDLGNLTVKDCIFRINRDIRFSKDKSPYKRNLSAGIGPGGRGAGRVDYYLHIQPDGESFLGGGMWDPTTEQLAKYRQEIDYNAQEIKDIINKAEFQAYFPEIHGSVLKTTPKGYPKDHPETELLKRKELFFMHRYTDKEVTSKGFAENIVNGIRLLKPYCDYMNYILHAPAEE